MIQSPSASILNFPIRKTFSKDSQSKLWIDQSCLKSYFGNFQGNHSGKMFESPKGRLGHLDWITEANTSPSHCDSEFESQKTSIGISTGEESGISEEIYESQILDIKMAMPSLSEYGICEKCIQANIIDEEAMKDIDLDEKNMPGSKLSINKILEDDIQKRI